MRPDHANHDLTGGNPGRSGAASPLGAGGLGTAPPDPLVGLTTAASDVLASRDVPTYWINHPTDEAFISAFSPEGVAQVLMVAERWTAGRYLVREHHHTGTPDRPWGYVVKDVGGDVWIEKLAEAAGD